MGLVPGGEILPDEDEYSSDPEIRWAPGTREAILNPSASLSPNEIKNKTAEILSTLKSLNSDFPEESLARLEEVLGFQETLSVIDDVLRKLIHEKGMNQTAVYNACRSLFFSTRNRGVLKFCMGIMSLYCVEDDIEFFKIVSRHEEFTLYGAVAVSMCTPDPVHHWIDMAGHVEGWGRIHLSNRLVEKAGRNDVREYLLKEGCKNTIGEEYTSLEIARSVKLDQILNTTKIDRKSFQGAGVLINGMIDATIVRGPFIGLEKYDRGFACLDNYLNLAQKMAKNSFDFLVAHKIFRFLHEEKDKADIEYIPAETEILKEKVQNILNLPHWKETVLKDLAKKDRQKQFEAVKASEILELDITPELIKMLKTNPHDDMLWYYLSSRINRENLQAIKELAIEKLDFKTKNTEETGAGLNEVVLSFLLNALENINQPDEEIILLGLQSTERNQRETFKVLHSWKPEEISENIIAQVRKLMESPTEILRLDAQALLEKV
ncbi:MAG: hypothetical protein ACLFQV_00815 [Vulcanimicrobiota bacterium]